MSLHHGCNYVYNAGMDKQKAIELLGGTAKSAAEAMGYTSVHAVYMWPDVLSREVVQRVMGVLAMQGKANLQPEKAA